MRTISRDELYEQVWKTPLRDVAKEYGLSDVGLAKICKRLGVPRPPQGHWVRIQHGHAIARPPLPACPPGTPDQLVVDDEPRVDEPRVQRPPAPSISVVEKLSKPHPTVRALLGLLTNDFRLRCMRVVRYPGQATLRVSEAHEDRAARILDALCRWLSDNHYGVTIADLPDDRRHHMLAVGRGDTAFRISLVERLKQVDHVPTAKEKADAARYSFMGAPKTDRVPTGKFALEFLQVGQWSRVYGTWKDGRRTIEEQLGEAVLRVPEIFLDIAEANRARVEAARREREAALIREQEAKRERHNAALIQDLDEMIGRWQHAQRIREFVSLAEPAILAAGPGDQTGQRAWMEWARAYADSIDPMVRPDSIAKALSPRD